MILLQGFNLVNELATSKSKSVHNFVAIVYKEGQILRKIVKEEARANVECRSTRMHGQPEGLSTMFHMWLHPIPPHVTKVPPMHMDTYGHPYAPIRLRARLALGRSRVTVVVQGLSTKSEGG